MTSLSGPPRKTGPPESPKHVPPVTYSSEPAHLPRLLDDIMFQPSVIALLRWIRKDWAWYRVRCEICTGYISLTP